MFIVAAPLLTLMTLDVPWGRECAPLTRRDWKARTTKNGGDGVECKDVCPGLYCLRFERICGRELLRDEVWVTKGTRNSGTTAKTLAYIRMRENRGRTC